MDDSPFCFYSIRASLVPPQCFKDAKAKIKRKLNYMRLYHKIGGEKENREEWRKKRERGAGAGAGNEAAWEAFKDLVVK